MKLDKHITEGIEKIYNLITTGVEAWIKAGEMIAEEIDKDPEFVDKFCDKHSDISPETVIRFELIGRRKLHPKTLLNESPGIRRLRRLPFQLQEKYVTCPVSLVVKSNGKYDILNVDVRNLTPDQAAQVFDSSGVRSEGAQRAWLEDKAASKLVVESQPDSPYRIVGKKLVVMSACQFTVRDLAQLMARIES